MPEQKTKPTAVSVDHFLDQVTDEAKRNDCYELINIMKEITGDEPKMWGTSIVGFGNYHYKYESGHEGYSCLTGFSPRKQNITIYLLPGIDQQSKLFKDLGKFKAGKGCLYIKRLSDINTVILSNMIEHSVNYLSNKYPK